MASSPAPAAARKVSASADDSPSAVMRVSRFFEYNINWLPTSIETGKKISDMTAEELFCLKRQNKLEEICHKESRNVAEDDRMESFDYLMCLATSRMEKHKLI